MHHWGEPYLGYYVANDEWVIQHASKCCPTQAWT